MDWLPFEDEYHWLMPFEITPNEELEYYDKFDPMWDDTLNFIVMLPEKYDEI